MNSWSDFCSGRAQRIANSARPVVPSLPIHEIDPELDAYVIITPTPATLVAPSAWLASRLLYQSSPRLQLTTSAPSNIKTLASNVRHHGGSSVSPERFAIRSMATSTATHLLTGCSDMVRAICDTPSCAPKFATCPCSTYCWRALGHTWSSRSLSTARSFL
jgi:hypothetical protein